jgi:hypothetical protein
MYELTDDDRRERWEAARRDRTKPSTSSLEVLLDRFRLFALGAQSPARRDYWNSQLALVRRLINNRRSY